MKYSIETNRILKSMYKTGSINKKQLSQTELHRLFQDAYITNSNNFHDNNVYLTDKGRAYVEEIKSEQKDKYHRIVHECFNTAIAIGALIVAILAYIKQ